MSFGHLQSNSRSCGHRFLAPEPFEVESFTAYEEELTRRYVMLDTANRKESILTQATELAEKNGFKLHADEGLLSEVAGLVEWPVVLLGDIDEEVTRAIVSRVGALAPEPDAAAQVCFEALRLAMPETVDG